MWVGASVGGLLLSSCAGFGFLGWSGVFLGLEWGLKRVDFVGFWDYFQEKLKKWLTSLKVCVTFGIIIYKQFANKAGLFH